MCNESDSFNFRYLFWYHLWNVELCQHDGGQKHRKKGVDYSTIIACDMDTR